MRVLLPIALAGLGALTGCVGYGGATYSSGGAYYNNSPYYGGSPYSGSTGVVIEQRYGRYPYGGYGTYSRRDRDGDGVPNWRDARPDDPRRY